MCIYWESHRENLSPDDLRKLEDLAARHNQTVEDLIRWIADN